MIDQSGKARAFIERLLLNPTLKGFTPLQKEESIIQFLNLNSQTLYPTLSSSAFFPGKSLNDIYIILTEALKTIIDQQMMSLMEEGIKRKINYSFISFMPHPHCKDLQLKDELFEFTKQLLCKKDARRTLTGSYAAFGFRLTDRYVDAIYRKHKYIHFELNKVEKLKMSQEEVKNFIKLNLFLRPAVYCLGEDYQNSRNAGANQVNGNLVKKDFIDQVNPFLARKLPHLPSPVILSALNSNVSFLENRFIEATSRLTSVFAIRCLNFKPNTLVDRGAESSDKSWFNIARKNYKYYGFDIKMLDELYNIAAENGW